MRRNGDVMFSVFEMRGEAHMASRLACNCVTKAGQGAGQIVTADVTRNLQAGITSCFIMCKRITPGFLPSSKWQESASRTAAFNSSRESA